MSLVKVLNHRCGMGIADPHAGPHREAARYADDCLDNGPRLGKRTAVQ